MKCGGPAPENVKKEYTKAPVATGGGLYRIAALEGSALLCAKDNVQPDLLTYKSREQWESRDNTDEQ